MVNLADITKAIEQKCIDNLDAPMRLTLAQHGWAYTGVAWIMLHTPQAQSRGWHRLR